MNKKQISKLLNDGRVGRVHHPLLERISQNISQLESRLDIFITHSSQDNRIVEALIDLMRGALNISSEKIRCSSVPGYRFPTGVDTDEQLRQEVDDAKVLVGVITKSSMRSAYVLFELGARWGAKKKMFPVLACGADSSVLGGPLKGINSLSCNNAADVHQLIDDIASELGIKKQRAASFQNKIETLVQLAQLENVENSSETQIEQKKEVFQIFKSQFLTFLRRFEADWISERDSEPLNLDSGINIARIVCDEVLDFRANIVQDDDSKLTGILDEAARRLKSLQQYEIHMYDEFWREGIEIINLLKRVPKVIDESKGPNS